MDIPWFNCRANGNYEGDVYKTQSANTVGEKASAHALFIFCVAPCTLHTLRHVRARCPHAFAARDSSDVKPTPGGKNKFN